MEYRAKKSGPMRFFVDSSDTALAPFSQNSKIVRFLSGLGHAQLWQSKPVTWLIFKKASDDHNSSFFGFLRFRLNLLAPGRAATGTQLAATRAEAGYLVTC